jgi:hypothetical protein
VAWELEYGPIPPGLNVLHKCDVPICVNPNHLFLGTQADNVADMKSKGRDYDRAGSGNPRAKLNIEMALKIMTDGRKYADIARDYGVTRSTIGRVKRRECWS